ncbi:hypothetical protein ACJJTC_008597 [Scirpophaga incertulas]
MNFIRLEMNAIVCQSGGIKRSASPAIEPREARAAGRGGSGSGACSAAGSPGGAAGPAPGAGPGARAEAGAAPAAPPPASPRAAAACPLLLNVLLTDTVLNVFRDHNFDSCTLCVCNAGPRVVGNIRGADAATYLSHGHGDWAGGGGGAGDEEPARCTCGFSAVVNRRLAHRAGLFYEDEMEITGLAPEPGGSGGGGGGGGGGGSGGGGAGGLTEVAGAVVALCAGPAAGAASAVARAAARAAAADDTPRAAEPALNLLEYSDGAAAAARALQAAGGRAGGAACAVHRWPFIGAHAPRSSRDVVRLMRRLRPLLQDAIQKRCCGARMWDGVSGPLTWRQFHRLAGRGNEDLCEPQPVPPLLVGHDRDWLSLSPYALRHWERLALEPYAYARDVAYVVVAADAAPLAPPLKAFFKELSAAYEGCRLGRHRPVARAPPDGIYRLAPATTGEEGTGRAGAYLRAYADALASTVLPTLAALPLDRSLFEERNARQTGSTNASPEGEDEASGAAANPSPWEEAEGGAPALVLYVVEPPGAAHAPAALRALLALAARAHHHLAHHNPLVKIISLEGVCETWGLGAAADAAGVEAGGGGGGGGGRGGGADVRALAFSVFCGARRLLQHRADGKSLTGFGTAATANLFLSSKDEKNRGPYRLFSPAWVLAPPRALKEVAETWGAGGEQAAVLFLAYCLSHDQRWLLAAATDARGELLDTAAINVHVPPRYLYIIKQVADTWGAGGEQAAVLFLAYCLSHDQRWLLAAATDARGELLDTAAINVHVPPRYLYIIEQVADTWGAGGEQAAVLFLAYCLSHDQRWLLAAATDARGELLDTAAINVHVPPRYLYIIEQVADTWGAGGEQAAVLFLAYCLSHDQRWLLAAATDARGELLDTAAINVHVPPRYLYIIEQVADTWGAGRRAGRRAVPGVLPLMDFTLGVMSQAAQPWRLVVGRVGRIGHGELKGNVCRLSSATSLI